MTTLLLVIIYLAFISLGLPDSLLGSAWPSMYPELCVPVSYAGIVSMIIAGGTILSSLMSVRLIKKFGTGIVTAVSVALTAIALLGFSVSNQFWQICLWGIPYGLGAGSVDAALNNYVALHFKSRHMNWLHCFWGLGATLGPAIMGWCLTGGRPWNSGYRVIGIMQVVLVVCLVLSLPLWSKKTAEDTPDGEQKPSLTTGATLRLPGAVQVLATFFCYCALESTTGLWASSYMVLFRGIDAKTAASWASLFYFGIMAGRFLCGLVSDKVGDRAMVRIGQGVLLAGIACVLLPLGNGMLMLALGLIGLGCAPVYPALIHATPTSFGAENSQTLIGLQMASAYTGSTFMPPLFGALSNLAGVGLYPVFLLFFAVGMVILSESMNHALKH